MQGFMIQRKHADLEMCRWRAEMKKKIVLVKTQN